MEINIKNFKLLKNNIDELFQYKKIYVEFLEQLEKAFYNNDIVYLLFMIKKFNNKNLLKKINIEEIEKKEDKQDTTFINLKNEIEKDLNNIELNILYRINIKYKKYLNKNLKKQEKAKIEIEYDLFIDEIAQVESQAENRLYNEYVLSVM